MTNEASLLDKYASEVFAGLVTPVLDGVHAEILASAAPASDLTKEDTLVRMTAELKRALEKPASERRWVMIIDLRKCVGCNAWGGDFWTDGYYVGTVGQHTTEGVIKQYGKNQGQEKEYVQLHVQLLKLF